MSRSTTLIFGLLLTASFTGCQSSFWPWSANEGPTAQVSDELGAAPSPDALASTLASAPPARTTGDWPTTAAQPVSYPGNGRSLSDEPGFSYSPEDSYSSCGDSSCGGCR